MRHCPKCASVDIHRSRLRTRWEHLRRVVTKRRPYRCPDCKWRGWGREEVSGPDTWSPEALALEASRKHPRAGLDLDAIDESLKRAQRLQPAPGDSALLS